MSRDEYLTEFEMQRAARETGVPLEWWQGLSGYAREHGQSEFSVFDTETVGTEFALERGRGGPEAEEKLKYLDLMSRWLAEYRFGPIPSPATEEEIGRADRLVNEAWGLLDRLCTPGRYEELGDAFEDGGPYEDEFRKLAQVVLLRAKAIERIRRREWARSGLTAWSHWIRASHAAEERRRREVCPTCGKKGAR